MHYLKFLLVAALLLVHSRYGFPACPQLVSHWQSQGNVALSFGNQKLPDMIASACSGATEQLLTYYHSWDDNTFLLQALHCIEPSRVNSWDDNTS